MKTFQFDAFDGIWKKREIYKLSPEDMDILHNGNQEQRNDLFQRKTALEQPTICNEEEITICEDYLEANKPTLDPNDNFVLIQMTFPFNDKPFAGALNYTINGKIHHKVIAQN